MRSCMQHQAQKQAEKEAMVMLQTDKHLSSKFESQKPNGFIVATMCMWGRKRVRKTKVFESEADRHRAAVERFRV